MIKKILKYLFSAAIILSFVTIAPTKNEVTIGAYRTTGMAGLVNTQRKNNNLSNLIYSNRLSSAAYTRAVNLSKNSQWSHAGFQEAVDKVAKSPVLYGENLGQDIPSDSVLIQRWMNSTEHRNNILNSKYKYFGFARYKNYAVLWFSEEY